MELYHDIVTQGLTLKGNIFLAPIAGFTDRAFRAACEGFGAGLAYTEMVSCEALARGNRKTETLMARADGEGPLAIQVFASNPETAERAMNVVLAYKPTLIDLNCGCPVPKIVKPGAGSALLKEPSRIRALVEAMRRASEVPVSVKIRSGWDADSINYLETAGAAVEGGACIVTLHARTKTQGYAGVSAWDHIKHLKRALPVPVIGSGDLFTAGDVKRMMEETGCDGVMIARGAIGNPFIFREAKAVLAGKEIEGPSQEERIEAAIRHLEAAIRYEGERKAVKEMKKHLCSYTKGLIGGAQLRQRIVHTESVDAYTRLFSAFLKGEPL
jgi:tRNA-dihydrouridine synthase B